MATTIQVTQALRRKVIEYLRERGSITVTRCRELLDLDYTQTVALLKQMVKSGELVQRGRTSGTRYMLP